MYCPYCGTDIPDTAAFCTHCGSATNAKAKKADTSDKSASVGSVKTSLVLSIIGAVVALVVFLISWFSYQRIYFFDGYTITKVAWLITFITTPLGLILFLSNKSYRKNRKKELSVILVCIGLVAVILLLSAVINKQTHSNDHGYSADYYQNLYESCHSTYEHKQAIYSYDLDNDNSISAYEMELFLKAHPRVTNDKQFMDWLESRVG